MNFRKYFIIMVILMIIASTFTSAVSAAYSGSDGMSERVADYEHSNSMNSYSMNSDSTNFDSTNFDSENDDSADSLQADSLNEQSLSAASADDDLESGFDISRIASFGNAAEFSTNDAYMTSLYTGAAVYTYPVKTPDGIAGLHPEITLTYNSQSSGGICGWLGDGWSLNEFYVMRDVYFTPENTSDDRFRLVFNGQSYDLSYNKTDKAWHTENESYLYIKKNSGGSNKYREYWTVHDKNGTEYRFGYAKDSELENTIEKRGYVMKWKLDRIMDTSGNTVTYSYDDFTDISGNETGTSYLKKITYNKGLTSIEFNRMSKPVKYSSYGDGSLVEEKSLLSNITIKVNNQTASIYAFSYETSGNHVFLKSVQYFGAGGLQSLPKTTFAYGSTSGKFTKQTPNLPAIDFSDGVGYTLIDLNGDNLQDLIYSSRTASKRKVWINNGKNFTLLSNFTFPYPVNGGFRFADVNGDGFIDILYYSAKPIDNKILINTYGKTGKIGFEEAGTLPMILLDGEKVFDFNKDGFADIIESDQANNSIYLGNGTGFTLFSKGTIPLEFSHYRSSNNILSSDINGDGLTDLIDRSGNVYICTGTGFVKNASWQLPIKQYNYNYTGMMLDDIDQDGLTDVLVSWMDTSFAPSYKNNNKSNITTLVYLNNGSGFVKNSSYEIPIVFGCGDSSTNSCLTDIDGDGISEFVLIRNSSYSWYNTKSQIWKSNMPVNARLLTQITSPTGAVTKIAYGFSSAFNNNVTVPASGNNSAFSINKLPQTIRVVTSVRTENGLTDSHKIVSEKTFSYKGGKVSIAPLGKTEFRGFAEVTENDGRSTTVHNYLQDDIKKGNEYITTVSASNGSIYSRTENIFSVIGHTGYISDKASTAKNLSVPASSNYNEVLMTKVRTNLYDGSKSPLITETTYDYTELGEIAIVRENGDISKTGDERKTTYSYRLNNSTHVYAMYRELVQDMSASLSKRNISMTTYFYDNNTTVGGPVKEGRLTKVIYWNNNGNDSVNSFTYDSYGNPASMTDGNGAVTTIAYGSDKIYPSSVKNALNQTTYLKYNLTTGKLTSVTDPNRYVTNATYDDFGRLTSIIRPGDNVSYPTARYSYSSYSERPYSIRSFAKKSNTGYYESISYFDGLGNSIKTVSDGAGSLASSYVTADNFYNAYGELSKSTIPAFCSSNVYAKAAASVKNTTYEYDSFGRVTLIKNPDNSTERYVYSLKNKTIYDENNHYIKYYYDVFDNIIKITEYNSGQSYDTMYFYDLSGNLIRIEPQNSFNQTNVKFLIDNGSYSNGTLKTLNRTIAFKSLSEKPSDSTFRSAATSYTYDSLGRMIAVSDPDIGNWSYSYDGTGNILSLKDARNITTKYAYDKLGRLTKIDYPNDADVIYTYDTQKIGTLYRVTSGTVNKTYGYDGRLRVIKETARIGNVDYVTTHEYDSMDRIVKTVHPNGKAVTYSYNNQTLLQSIPGVVKNIGYNAQNLMTEKSLANNVTTKLTYNASTSRLSGIMTGNRQSSGNLQNLNYTFDKKGNIIRIKDVLINETQNFVYDDLDRLILACGKNYSQSFAYNPLGSIIGFRSKEVTNNRSSEKTVGFEYGKTVSGKNCLIHAPTAAGSARMTYDACGNLLSDSNFTYTYDNADRLKTVTDKKTNKVISQFFYDENGNRVKKIENNKTTLYITNEYEIEDNKSVIYYYANGNRIAKESSGKKFWYLADHLGSTNVMTDASGNLVERTLYYPFGGYRSGVSDEKYGFTGKEFDDGSNLYYYGARYYNPETFVFTQADTLTPDAYKPQSLNRYSYCLNNPLKYDDPNGHTPTIITAAIGVVVGAAVGMLVEVCCQTIECGHVAITDKNAVLKAGVLGGISGGLAGLTCGLSYVGLGYLGIDASSSVIGGILLDIGVGSVSNAVGNSGSRAVESLYYDQKNITETIDYTFNNDDVSTDLAIGGIVRGTGKTTKYLSGKLTDKDFSGNFWKVVNEGASQTLSTGLYHLEYNIRHNIHCTVKYSPRMTYTKEASQKRSERLEKIRESKS